MVMVSHSYDIIYYDLKGKVSQCSLGRMASLPFLVGGGNSTTEREYEDHSPLLVVPAWRSGDPLIPDHFINPLGNDDGVKSTFGHYLNSGFEALMFNCYHIISHRITSCLCIRLQMLRFVGQCSNGTLWDPLVQLGVIALIRSLIHETILHCAHTVVAD